MVSFSAPLDPDQRFDSLLTLANAQGERLEGGWILSDNLQELRRQPIEPERTFSLQISADIRSVADVPLGKGESHQLTTRAQPPSLGFASRGSLLPMRLADGLPVIAVNVDKVDVEFFRLRPERLHSFLSEWNRQSAMDLWQLEAMPTNAQLVHTAQFALNPPANTRERLMLPLDDIAALAEPGVFVAVMRPSGTFEYSLPVTVFSRSDIGLSVRRSATGLDAFVQSLDEGLPLAEVRLELLDAKGLTLAEGRSDSDGHVRLPTHKDARLLLATRERATTLLRLQDAALDLAEFAVSGPQAEALNLFAFGPRDLYRPGETVPVNALLRDADGHAQPPQPIPTRILRPDGEVVRSFVWQAGDEGLYQYSYPLSESAQTGRWRMQMDLGGQTPAVYEFLVEDFLPERLALEISPDTTAPLAPQDDAHFTLEGRYLYGAPAAGNRLIGQLFVEPLREAVPELPGFQFG
ncbi:MG2 domain-containing protein, partial [Nitrincola sp. A-D6]|uniref:MG2 domain-containing protein n=1 Tax=Nitrincola sp. A-D6 TaxID=1545442 RepID=UPI001F322A2E